MKKIIFLTLLIVFALNLKAQNTDCSFIPPSYYSDLSRFTNRYQSIPDDGRKFVLNVKFLYTLGDLGENPYDLNEDKMLKICATANIKFNQYGIFFKYRGSESINDSNFTDLNQNNLTVYTLRQKFIDLNLYDPNSINVFVVRGGNSAFDTDLILNSSNTDARNDSYYVPNEFGHVLGLLHTEGSTGGDIISENLPSCIATHPVIQFRKICKPYFVPNYNYYENVTRDPKNPIFNADIKGDYVTDTDASFESSVGSYLTNYCRSTSINTNFEYSFENFNEDLRVVDNSGDPNTSCFYCFTTATKYSYNSGDNYYTTLNNNISTSVDLGTSTWQNIVNTSLINCTQIGSGETYKIGPTLIHNIMSAAVYPTAFTAGQGQRMRERLLGNFTNSNPYYLIIDNKLNLNADGTPNISVLYQPFQSSKTITSIASTTDNGNGTATVCQNYVSSGYRFQPGFDYEFPENEAPDLNIYSTSQTPLVATPHYNCPVKILQLSNDIGHAYTVCRGVDCVIENLRSGTIFSTQVLGSMNITVEELDAIEVKDPYLYDNLMSQYYYILKKETDCGAKIHEVFYKN